MQICGYHIRMPYLQMASPKQMAKNLCKVSLIAIPLIFSINAIQTNAAPGSYATCFSACIATCSVATSGGFLPACMIACTQFCAHLASIPSI